MMKLMTMFAMFVSGALASALPPLTLEQRTALRCSAAFSWVALAQRDGNATQYPPLEERGREYAVRAMAKIMDDTGADRAAITALAQNEARLLLGKAGEVEQAMPPCLALLERAGL